jgi:hypothetical protein
MARTRDVQQQQRERDQAAEASLNLWRLCDELTVVQAALLVIACDPGGPDGYAEGYEMHKRPPGYEAAKQAIANALRRDEVKGRMVQNVDFDINGNRVGAIADSIDVAESRVDVESLKKWLISRGVRTGFFFPIATGAPDYLDPQLKTFVRPDPRVLPTCWEARVDQLKPISVRRCAVCAVMQV